MNRINEPVQVRSWTASVFLAAAFVLGAARAWTLPCPTDNLFHLVRVGRSLLAGSLDPLTIPPGGHGASPLGSLLTGIAALLTNDAELVSRTLGAVLLGLTAAALAAWLQRSADRPVAILAVALLIVPTGFATSFAARPDTAIAGLLLLMAMMGAASGRAVTATILASVAVLASPVAWPALAYHVWSAKRSGCPSRTLFAGPAVIGIALAGLLAGLPAGSRGQLLAGLATGWGVPGEGFLSSMNTAWQLWGAGILLVIPAVLPFARSGSAISPRVHIPWLTTMAGALLLSVPGAFRGATAALLPGACLLFALIVHELSGPAQTRPSVRRPVLLALLVPLVLLLFTHGPEGDRRHEIRAAAARSAHLGAFFRTEFRQPGALLAEAAGALACFSSRPVMTLADSGELPLSRGERDLPRAVVFERGIWPTTRPEIALFENPRFLASYCPLSIRHGPGLRNRDDIWTLRQLPVRIDSIPTGYSTKLRSGWEAHGGGRNEDAQRDFEQAALQEPSALGLAHEWAGMMAELEGNAAEAQASYEAARERDPAAARARGYLADLALARGKLRAADALVAEALINNPYEGRLWGTAARVHQVLGLARQAEESSARAVYLDPTNTRLLVNHGSLLWAAGRPDTARIFWERAVALDPNSTRFLGDFRRAAPGAPAPPLLPLYSFAGFAPRAPTVE